MGRDSLRLRMNRDREKLLGRAEELLGEDQSSKAIDAALAHLVESAEAYEDVKGELTPEQAETLSTEVVSINHYPQVKTGGR